MLRRFRFIAAALSVVGGAAIALSACGDDEPLAAPTADDAATETSVVNEAGSDAPSTPTEGAGRSGSRLKLQGIESEGTFVPSSELYDSKLEASCFYARSMDGAVRCIPSSQGSVAGYSDDQCQTKIASVSRTLCRDLKFVADSITGVDSCDNRTTAYKVGTKITPLPVTIYQKNAGGGCVGSPVANGDLGVEYYTLGAIVPEGDLVKGVMVDVPASAEISISVFEGEDGSRLVRGLTDVRRNKPCGISTASDSKIRCTPSTGHRVDLNFTDNTCTARAGDAPYCLVPYEPFDSATASTYEPLKCKRAMQRIFPLGPKRGTRDVYKKLNDGGCGESSMSPQDVFDLGAELPAATFPEVTDTTIGGPRIVIANAFLSAGVKIAESSFNQARDTTVDTTSAGFCDFTKAADGSLRCLPQLLGAFFFSDDQCTARLGVSSDECVNGKYIAQRDDVACTTKMFQLGTKVELTTPHYMKTPGGCLQITGSSAVALYTLGAEVPPSTFAAGTNVIKP